MGELMHALDRTGQTENTLLIFTSDNGPERAVGDDSVSILPELRGESGRPVRGLVHHSGSGTYAIREGDWVFIDAPKGGVWPEPTWFREERGYEDNTEPGELYNLANDLPEHDNLYAEHPEIVDRLKRQLDEIKAPA